jgi:transcriptional regulator with XRE-family HTH domain
MIPNAILRRERLKAGVSQGELARRMGRDQAWVSRTERGAYAVTVTDYTAWMQALGLIVSLDPLPPDDIMGRFREVVAAMNPEQVETLLTLARLIGRITPRVLRGLILFAESQAQAETAAG